MKLGYLEFVEVLSKQLLNALNLQEQQIFFKKKAIDNKDRLFVETFENLSGKQLCGIDVKDLYERFMEGSSMESIFYSCLLYTSPSPRDATLSRMPSSA